jgi:hypothetical protein
MPFYLSLSRVAVRALRSPISAFQHDRSAMGYAVNSEASEVRIFRQSIFFSHGRLGGRRDKPCSVPSTTGDRVEIHDGFGPATPSLIVAPNWGSWRK